MGRENLLSDPRLTGQVALNAHEDEIDEIVGEWTARHTLEQLEAVLDKAAVPAVRSAIICTMYRSN